MTLLKILLETSLSPVGIMTLLFLAGMIFSLLRRKSRLGPRMVWAGAWLCLAFLITPISEVLVANLERPYPPVLHVDPSTGERTLVVLSGYGRESSSLPVTSKLGGETILRMVEGIRLYREIPGARLILSGGVVNDGDGPIANLMAEFARTMGVPDRDLVLEGRSTTTWENLVEVKKIVGADPFLLVTSACDLRRAMGVARKLEMRASPVPVAIWAAHYDPAGMSWGDWAWRTLQDFLSPSTSRFMHLQWAYHEYLGYLWYQMLGRV